jgi:ribosome maturation factor RimP
LRTAAHFQREVGKDITVRLAGDAVSEGAERRLDGKLVAADETTATVLTASGEERTIDIDAVDKARTVFEWGPKPKPGKGPGNTRNRKNTETNQSSERTVNKEKQKS